MSHPSSLPLYPLTFDAPFKRKIWGGDRIFKYKGLPSPYDDIGESWEVSPMPGDESVVAAGPLKGVDLSTLTQEYGERLLGHHVRERFGDSFPLLIKVIDSRQDLSVQVHPNDDYAREHEHSRGKTEMWYLLDPTPDATIRAGWSRETSPEQLRELVKSDAVMDYIHSYHAERGDVFYLPAGKVHTIGAGCLLLEIQEASDITYRLYDFGRTDAQGRTRELHIDRAVEVINYEVDRDGKATYDRERKDALVTLVRSPYFCTSVLRLTKDFALPVAERDSFTYLFCEEGEVAITTDGGELRLTKGHGALLPAELHRADLCPLTPETHLIDVYVPQSHT